MTRRHFFFLLSLGVVVVAFYKESRPKFRLAWGIDAITEGTEAFYTAEQAYHRVYYIYENVGLDYGSDAVQGLKERGKFEYHGWWIRLDNGRA
jgi:hypothetical protein